jgi:hypothetical protein
MKHFILAILLAGSALTTAKADDTNQGFSILAGEGLTNSGLFSNNISGGSASFNEHGFIMGFEYSHMLGNSPFAFNVTFVTNDSFLLGAGFNILPFLTLKAKVGYGLTNDTLNSYYAPSTSEQSTNYGLVESLGGEIKFSDTFGIQGEYMTSHSVLGGFAFHW